MLSQINYIYTNNGIYTVNELYTQCTAYNTAIAANAEQTTVTKPSIITFDTDLLQYKFTSDYTITVTDEDNMVNMYECKFIDGYNNRTVTLNCTSDSQIYQYNILVTDKYSLINKNIQVLLYIQNNKTRKKINLGWKSLSELYNYATRMHNICLGDNILKFVSKIYKQPEIGYTISVPCFACMTVSTMYNFILIK
jgi:hypothetical protein